MTFVNTPDDFVVTVEAVDSHHLVGLYLRALKERLAGNFSDEAIEEAAGHFDVSELVVRTILVNRNNPLSESFTWYKSRSRAPIPAGKVRVVIWVSQI